MRIYLVGAPGELGGAGTEVWATLKLWRRAAFDVHIIPTWGLAPHWREKLHAIGCTTHEVSPDQLEQVPGLAGSVVVSFCNGEFLKNFHRFRTLGCRLVWVNCMTFLFAREKQVYAEHGLPDAFVFQSEYKRSQLEPGLAPFGYQPELGHLVRGAFDFSEWEFRPRPHGTNETFVVGRVARADPDKWSSNTWPIYQKIAYRQKRALMLGMNEKTHAKLGTPPTWADCLQPTALTAQQFFATLHCTLPINGGAKENWPRAGLEAMASGVPVVAQNDWGWREMIVPGETGFLGNCDEELAHYVAMLAYDEPLRLRIAKNARERLENELANPEKLTANWRTVFELVKSIQAQTRVTP